MSEPLVSTIREPKRKRESGIYQILCKPTQKVYVGSAAWLARRKRDHREALRAGTHYNSYLQKAWNKYSADAFEFSVLERCEKERLTELEQVYIDLLKAANPEHGFNLQPKAHSNLGMIASAETKAKLSAARKGKSTLSLIQIEELRERMKGNSFRLGIKHTPETRERMKESNKGKKRFLGGHHTEEARKKMSEARRGGILSKEHKEKIAQAHRGKIQTVEHRRNLAIVQSKIKPDQFEKIKMEYIPGIIAMHELAARYGCCTQTICNVINNKRMVSP